MVMKMSENNLDRAAFFDKVLCKDIKTLIDMLTPLASSYRLMVGAADEFNKISLAHRKDVEDAIDRADDLGHIIEDVEERLKRVLRIYLKGVDYKTDSLYKDELDALLCEEPGWDFQNVVKGVIIEENDD